MGSHDIEELVALEPILAAPRHELESLQLERLKATLQHAYANNANYTRKFDAAGVHPDDLRTLADLAASRSPPRRICARHIRSDFSRCPENKSRAFTPPPAPPVNPPSSAIRRGRSCHLGQSGRAIDPGGRRPCGHEGAHRLRLWSVHRRIGRALRCRSGGMHGDPDVGRTDGKAGAIDPRFRARHHHGDAKLHARHSR